MAFWNSIYQIGRQKKITNVFECEKQNFEQQAYIIRFKGTGSKNIDVNCQNRKWQNSKDGRRATCILFIVHFNSLFM